MQIVERILWIEKKIKKLKEEICCVRSSTINLGADKTPTSSSDTSGSLGDIVHDSSYVYVKTSAGWKRSALTTF